MNATEKDPDQLAELTDSQLETMVRLIKTGKLDFEIHRTNPGHYSHDIGISIDHDDLMAAIAKESGVQFSLVDEKTGEPCPREGKTLCTITDRKHRHVAAHMFNSENSD
jgi:hypothetical protein